MNKAAFRAAIFVFGAFAAVPASADELLVPLAHSGDWGAYSHRKAMLEPPDSCILFDQQGLIFKIEPGRFDIRVVDDKWSLPPDTHGTITATAGGWTKTFEIDDNSDTMVMAPLDPNDVPLMFAAMDKAAAMQIKIGNALPRTFSLKGSARVTAAFRTCAGIKGATSTPETNPFK